MIRNFHCIMRLLVLGTIILSSLPMMGMNLLMRPYDSLLLPDIHREKCYELAFWAERGVRPAEGYNSESQRVDIFNVWNPYQDALAMLEGFPTGTPQSLLLKQLNAADDGIRGTFDVTGKLALDVGAVVGTRWYFLPNAWITAFIPFYKAQLSDVAFQDRTQLLTPADFRVKNLLTSRLQSVVTQMGNGLSIEGWKRAGPGDLNLLVEFLFSFPQKNRPVLQNVDVGGRVGFTLPTGLKSDEDKLLAFPFGFNGAVGILYAGCLNVVFADYIRGGVDVQLLHLFGNTRERRIKTAMDQTDFLLLAKTPAYTDYGLMQRFNLFIQAYNIKGASLLFGYQFLKKGEDHLALNTCDYSTTLANTAASLDEWIVHSIELNLHYDFSYYKENPSIIPQASIFARLPFNGRRAVAFTTVGAMVSIDF